MHRDRYIGQVDDKSISSNAFSRYADGTKLIRHEGERDGPDYAKADKEHTMKRYGEYKAFSGRPAQEDEGGNDCGMQSA